MELLGQQHAQGTWKALSLLLAYLPGSWEVRHATTSQAFPSSPTTFSTTFAAERRPGGYSSSVDLWEIKENNSNICCLCLLFSDPKYRFPSQLCTPALCLFPSFCNSRSSPAPAAVIFTPVNRSGVKKIVSFPQKKKPLPNTWNPTSFRSSKDLLRHVARDLKGSPAVQLYPSPMKQI